MATLTIDTVLRCRICGHVQAVDEDVPAKQRSCQACGKAAHFLRPLRDGERRRWHKAEAAGDDPQAAVRALGLPPE